MKKDKLLITGGVGFIGAHLINTLLEKGFKDIIVIDKEKPRLGSIKHVQADFANEKVVRPLLEECDVLFHLAAMIGVDNCRNHPDLVKQVNLINTKKLIDWSVESGVRRIIFTSSSEVYGNSKDIPYKEYGKLEPVSVYGQAKVDIEKYLLEIQSSNKTTVGIARLFNVYGPGQKKDFVVSIFVKAAINNTPIQIFGSGKQTRTFTYVGDVADGIFKLYEYEKTPYEIVNLGSNQEYSIKELAKFVLDCLSESTLQIEYAQHGHENVRTSNFEIDRRVPSTKKAKNLLNFDAKTTLTEGLVETISYIKKADTLPFR